MTDDGLPTLTIQVEFELTRGELAMIIARYIEVEVQVPETREEVMAEVDGQLWQAGMHIGEHEDQESFTLALLTVNKLFPELRPAP